MTPSCEKRQGKNHEASQRYRVWGACWYYTREHLVGPLSVVGFTSLRVCSGSIPEDRFGCIVRHFSAPTTQRSLALSISETLSRSHHYLPLVWGVSILEAFPIRLRSICRSVFMPLVMFTGEEAHVCLCLMIQPPSGSRNGFSASR